MTKPLINGTAVVSTLDPKLDAILKASTTLENNSLMGCNSFLKNRGLSIQVGKLSIKMENENLRHVAPKIKNANNTEFYNIKNKATISIPDKTDSFKITVHTPKDKIERGYKVLASFSGNDEITFRRSTS